MDKLNIKSNTYGTEYYNIEFRKIYDREFLINSAIIFELKPVTFELYKSNNALGVSFKLFNKGFTLGFGYLNA